MFFKIVFTIVLLQGTVVLSMENNHGLKRGRGGDMLEEEGRSSKRIKLGSPAVSLQTATDYVMSHLLPEIAVDKIPHFFNQLYVKKPEVFNELTKQWFKEMPSELPRDLFWRIVGASGKSKVFVRTKTEEKYRFTNKDLQDWADLEDYKEEQFGIQRYAWEVFCLGIDQYDEKMMATYDDYTWDSRVKPSTITLYSCDDKVLYEEMPDVPVRMYFDHFSGSPNCKFIREIVPNHCRFFCKIKYTEDAGTLLMLHSISKAIPSYMASMKEEKVHVFAPEGIINPTTCYVDERGSTAYVNYQNIVSDRDIQCMCDTYELQDAIGTEVFGHYVAHFIKELNTRAMYQRLPKIKEMYDHDFFFKLVEFAGSLSFRNNELMSEILAVHQDPQRRIDLDNKKFGRFAQLPKNVHALINTAEITVRLQEDKKTK
jgi:hypothetical protein